MAQGAYKETFIGPLSVQKLIYNYLILNLVMIALIICQPQRINPIIQSKKFLTPFCTFFIIILMLFFNDTVQKYLELNENVPKPDMADIQFVTW